MRVMLDFAVINMGVSSNRNGSERDKEKNFSILWKENALERNHEMFLYKDYMK